MTTNRYEAHMISLFRSVPSRTWLAMGAAFVTGILVHLSALTGIMVNGDNMVPVSSSQWLLTQGKWAFGILADLRGYVNMNIVTGLIGLLWLSAVAGCTVSVLDIRSGLFAALTGAMISAFPSVMCTFLYNAPDAFFFALLLSALAVLFTVRYRLGFLAGIPLLTVSLGAYQTYIGFAAGLFVLVSLFDLLDGKKPLRAVLQKGLLYIGVLLVSAALYYGILMLFIGSPENLQSYRSMDQLGSFTLQELFTFTRAAYDKVLRFFLLDAYGSTGSGSCMILYRLTLVFSALFAFVRILRGKLWQSPVRLLLAAVLAALFPIAIHAIVILGKNADTHWLMIYPFVLTFTALLKLADTVADPVTESRQPEKPAIEAGRFAVKVLTAALAVLMIVNWYLVSTQNYARMRLAYEGGYGTCAVIAAGVLNEESFTEETPVAVIGYIGDESEDFAYLDNFTGSFDRDYLFNSWIVQRMIARYVQIPMTFVDIPEKEAILASDWFAAMPAYPNKGYIAAHNGMLVVKLSADEPVIFG